MSAEIPNYEAEMARSRDFFMSPDNYAPIATVLGDDGEKLKIVDCIDPRGKKSTNPIKTSIQTGGGVVGVGLDQAIAMSLDRGHFTNLKTGIAVESAFSRYVGDVHHTCAFIGKIIPVVSEMQAPSEQTLQTIDRWLYLHNHYTQGTVTRRVMGKVISASAYQLEYLEAKGHLKKINDYVDWLWPHHANVAEMEGEPLARFWIDNHSENMGLDREKKHRESRLVIKAYHNSVGAGISEIANGTDHVGKEKEYKLGAWLLRGAATRTLLGGQHDDMEFLDVLPRQAGSLEIVRAA